MRLVGVTENVQASLRLKQGIGQPALQDKCEADGAGLLALPVELAGFGAKASTTVSFAVPSGCSTDLRS